MEHGVEEHTWTLAGGWKMDRDRRSRHRIERDRGVANGLGERPNMIETHAERLHSYRLTRPYVGFRPTTPQNDAGMRMDPPVSVPVAIRAIRLRRPRRNRRWNRRGFAADVSNFTSQAAESDCVGPAVRSPLSRKSR